jgi:hypothetical protein
MPAPDHRWAGAAIAAIVSPPDEQADRARLLKAQADKAERENEVERGELVSRSRILAGLAVMDAALKDRLMMVPTSAAPEALTTAEHAGAPGIAEVYRRHIGQALADFASAQVVAAAAPKGSA